MNIFEMGVTNSPRLTGIGTVGCFCILLSFSVWTVGGSALRPYSFERAKRGAFETTTWESYNAEDVTMNPFFENENGTASNQTDLAVLTPEEEFAFEVKRKLAIHNVLRRVLVALGPAFVDRLPIAPTNATITQLNSTIKEVDSEACPDHYKRCSSQTFFPSCQVPRNTDEQMWNQRFTLFFNISSEISTIHRQDILNATLRLYKNMSLPLETPKQLIVKLHVIIRGLQRNREKTKQITSTRVMSDYVGWIFLDVYKLVKRLKSNNNYGIKISIQDEDNIPWNVPNLFIKMNCQASNETLMPLPFEVMQFENDTQRYPALNIRSGSQESIEESDYFDALTDHNDTIWTDPSVTDILYSPLAPLSQLNKRPNWIRVPSSSNDDEAASNRQIGSYEYEESTMPSSGKNRNHRHRSASGHRLNPYLDRKRGQQHRYHKSGELTYVDDMPTTEYPSNEDGADHITMRSTDDVHSSPSRYVVSDESRRDSASSRRSGEYSPHFHGRHRSQGPRNHRRLHSSHRRSHSNRNNGHRKPMLSIDPLPE